MLQCIPDGAMDQQSEMFDNIKGSGSPAIECLPHLINILLKKCLPRNSNMESEHSRTCCMLTCLGAHFPISRLEYSGDVKG